MAQRFIPKSVLGRRYLDRASFQSGSRIKPTDHGYPWEGYMDQHRTLMYGGALVIALGAAMIIAAVSGGADYKACRDAGNSPFRCWVSE